VRTPARPGPEADAGFSFPAGALGDTAVESLGTLLVGRMASDKLNFHITPSEASVTPIDASSDQGTPAPERAICAGNDRHVA
jgi:hypothetical protein